MKIDKRRKYIALFDVETAGKNNQYVYDVGMVITDKQGTIYSKHSYIIKEVFSNIELMNTAYYRRKIPIYQIEIAKGFHEIIEFADARKRILMDMEKYGVSQISAYNLAFDIRALTSTTQLLQGKKNFLISQFKKVELLDIWSLACETIFQQKTFHHKAIAQRWINLETGNVKTSAETAYRYITNNPNFYEEHTGLADALIEAKIMAYCYKQKKPYSKGIISHPWKKVNTKKWKDYRQKQRGENFQPFESIDGRLSAEYRALQQGNRVKQLKLW